jgi:hypothetical protein
MAFIGGLLGHEALAAMLVALAAFIMSCGYRGTWWFWFVLAISGWAAGSLVLVVLGLRGEIDLPEQASQVDTSLTIVVTLFSAVAGTCLNRAALRIRPER